MTRVFSKKHAVQFLILICLSLLFYGFSYGGVVNYSDAANWAWQEDKSQGVDVFFIAPSVYPGSSGRQQMPLSDEEAKNSFKGAIAMEKGMYDAAANFFAPYYRQISLKAYELSVPEREKYLERAYDDIRAAFIYFRAHHDKPLILAGFSQGADMGLRLLKEFGNDTALQKSLVAAYLIGWHFTAEEAARYPYIRLAQSETDTGVVILFDAEAPEVKATLLVPVSTKSINPLNWKTDGTPASKEVNRGARFTDYTGKTTRFIPRLTGAFIDPVRGTLKVPDVSPRDFPPLLSLFPEGSYHVYDYLFFYENIRENVSKRMEAYSDRKK